MRRTILLLPVAVLIAGLAACSSSSASQQHGIQSVAKQPATSGAHPSSRTSSTHTTAAQPSIHIPASVAPLLRYKVGDSQDVKYLDGTTVRVTLNKVVDPATPLTPLTSSGVRAVAVFLTLTNTSGSVEQVLPGGQGELHDLQWLTAAINGTLHTFRNAVGGTDGLTGVRECNWDTLSNVGYGENNGLNPGATVSGCLVMLVPKSSRAAFFFYGTSLGWII